jgi:hypothetical protein
LRTGTVLVALVTSLISVSPGISQVSLYPSERDGQPVYVFENEYIRSEIAYTNGRSPLTYFDKISGVEQLRQMTPLSQNHGKHQSFGGVSESVPWTGGSPYMGYLWTQPWEMAVRTYDDHVVLVGEMTFPYPDPVTGRLCELRFEKTMTAYKGSTRLRMDYKIENVGQRRARFQHCVHGSPCVGGTCDDGDYFYAPGDSAWVVWSGLLPKYEIPDESWHSWPIPEAIDFRRSDSKEGLQLFVPAPWGVIGDEKTQEVMAMVNSPVVVGGNREIPMYVGLTKSGEKYYLEPSLTRHISNQPERWEREGFSVDLDRGEAAVYTVDMAMFHGVSKDQILSLHALLGDYLLLAEPRVQYGSGSAVVEIGIAVSGDAQLIIAEAASGKVLSTTDLVPGNVKQITINVALSGTSEDVIVFLKNAAGKQILVDAGAGG